MSAWYHVPPRNQTPGEEAANSITHGLGLLAAIAGTPFLILKAAGNGETGFLVGASLFCASMILLYLASTLYHALPVGRGKQIFKTVEHSAIYILIAGTYSPLTLGVLFGPWGWSLLGTVWGLAAAGTLVKIFSNRRHPILSGLVYLLMGWLIVVAIGPLKDNLHTAGLAWLVAGGLSYSIGLLFFAFDARLRYGHFIWHLFVLGGTFCHYWTIYHYGA